MNTLEIPRTRQYDAGEIAVIAQNPEGSATTTTTLTVTTQSDYRTVLKQSTSSSGVFKGRVPVQDSHQSRMEKSHQEQVDSIHVDLRSTPRQNSLNQAGQIPRPNQQVDITARATPQQQSTTNVTVDFNQQQTNQWQQQQQVRTVPQSPPVARKPAPPQVSSENFRQKSNKRSKHKEYTVFAEINVPDAWFLVAIKNIPNPSKAIGFVYSPFEKSPIKAHRFCVLPPLKNHPSKPIGFVYSPLFVKCTRRTVDFYFWFFCFQEKKSKQKNVAAQPCPFSCVFLHSRNSNKTNSHKNQPSRPNSRPMSCNSSNYSNNNSHHRPPQNPVKHRRPRRPAVPPHRGSVNRARASNRKPNSRRGSRKRKALNFPRNPQVPPSPWTNNLWTSQANEKKGIPDKHKRIFQHFVCWREEVAKLRHLCPESAKSGIPFTIIMCKRPPRNRLFTWPILLIWKGGWHSTLLQYLIGQKCFNSANMNISQPRNRLQRRNQSLLESYFLYARFDRICLLQVNSVNFVSHQILYQLNKYRVPQNSEHTPLKMLFKNFLSFCNQILHRYKILIITNFFKLHNKITENCSTKF